MEEQGFIRYLSLFFTSWLKEHGQLLEQASLSEPLMQALGYLIMMSNIPDKEVFKICLEYWSTLASSIFNEPCVLCLGVMVGVCVLTCS